MAGKDPRRHYDGKVIALHKSVVFHLIHQLIWVNIKLKLSESTILTCLNSSSNYKPSPFIIINYLILILITYSHHCFIQAGEAAQSTFKREERWHDKSYLLKNYHNIVKRCLINGLSRGVNSHLDLACGRFL